MGNDENNKTSYNCYLGNGETSNYALLGLYNCLCSSFPEWDLRQRGQRVIEKFIVPKIKSHPYIRRAHKKIRKILQK